MDCDVWIVPVSSGMKLERMDLVLSSRAVLIFPLISRSSDSDFLSHLFVHLCFSFRKYSFSGDTSPEVGLGDGGVEDDEVEVVFPVTRKR